MNNTDRQKALDAALAQIDRAFGKGSVMKLGSKEAMQVEAISTGSLGLDIALGVGGLPRGRVIEIYGPESSGKTTLALHVLAEAQKGGGTVAFVDAEHALDPVYARKLGVNIDELIISQPDPANRGLARRTLGIAPCRQQFTQFAHVFRGMRIVQSQSGQRTIRTGFGGLLQQTLQILFRHC